MEAILISVISMLEDPNDDSPANIDAGIMWREDKKKFKRMVRRMVDKSMDDC